MLRLKKLTAIILLTMVSVFAQAQTEAADDGSLMRSNGRIYVVVAVVVTILLGLFAYVYNLDRKISKMEQKN